MCYKLHIIIQCFLYLSTCNSGILPETEVFEISGYYGNVIVYLFVLSCFLSFGLNVATQTERM